MASTALRTLLVAALLAAPPAAAQERCGTESPERAEGYRDGAAEARTKPLVDWMLIGAGGSLLSSGFGTVCMPPAPFLVDWPERPYERLDPTRGEEYALGYAKGYDQTLRSRRALAGFASAATVATLLAVGYGLAVTYRAQEAEDSEAFAAPLLRF